MQKEYIKTFVEEVLKPAYEKNVGVFTEELNNKALENPVPLCLKLKKPEYINQLLEYKVLNPQGFGGLIYNIAFVGQNLDLLELIFTKGLDLGIPNSEGIIPLDRLCYDLKERGEHHKNNLNNLKALSKIIAKQIIPKECIDGFLITVLDQIYLWYIKQRGDPEFDNAIIWILRRNISRKKLNKALSWCFVYKYYLRAKAESLILLAHHKDSESFFYKDRFSLDLLKQVFMFIK